MEDEHRAYHSLVADGGRPSHPLNLLEKVVVAPGKYRDILNYWQDRPDEWQVFTKQWQRWRGFRKAQSRRRQPGENSLVDYANRLEAYLRKRCGFEFPPSFRVPSGGLRQDPGRQDKLATWIEYLCFEYNRLDKQESLMKEHIQDYLEARDRLIKSGILDASDQRMEADICNPSSIEIARRMYEKRHAKSQQRYPPKSKRDLERMDYRARLISGFKTKSRPYRLARDKAERLKLLLKWILDQVPLIEEEESSEAKGETTTPEKPCGFPHFRRLPAELRHMIWIESLPPRPTAHFFDVLNHPRKPHHAHHWSKGFRLSATKAHDSGYRVVYALLATCREARIVMAQHYRRLQQDHSIASGQLWQHPFPVFQTFNWIPADDLVVLCFPPKQASLPPKHAITFSRGPARHVGIYLPREVLLITQFGIDGYGEYDRSRHRTDEEGFVDDESQIPLIPDFLELLRSAQTNETDGGPGPSAAVGGGVKTVYLVFQGWCPHKFCFSQEQKRTASTPRQWLTASRERHIMWCFDAARESETISPWNRLSRRGAEAHESGTHANGVGSLRRRFWWLGSGDNALAGLAGEDAVERSPARCVLESAGKLERGCRARGWGEFEGLEILGWMA